MIFYQDGTSFHNISNTGTIEGGLWKNIDERLYLTTYDNGYKLVENDIESDTLTFFDTYARDVFLYDGYPLAVLSNSDSSDNHLAIIDDGELFLQNSNEKFPVNYINVIERTSSFLLRGSQDNESNGFIIEEDDNLILLNKVQSSNDIFLKSNDDKFFFIFDSSSNK